MLPFLTAKLLLIDRLDLHAGEGEGVVTPSNGVVGAAAISHCQYDTNLSLLSKEYLKGCFAIKLLFWPNQLLLIILQGAFL